MNLHLSQYGSSIKLDNGQFKIRTKEKLEVLNPSLVKRIYLNRSVSLSTDVLFKAIEMGIPIILKQRNGQVAGRMWSAKYGSITTLRRRQLQLSEGENAYLLIKDILNQKLLNQYQLLLIFDPQAKDELDFLEGRRAQIERHRRKLLASPISNLKDFKKKVMGYEGSAGRAYFETISHFLPKMYQFAERAQRPAGDMFNSSLNYCYGMLYSLIEGFLIESGLDPYTGLLHRDDYNKPVFVYDIIERYRIWADLVVIRLCRQYILFEDFFIREGEALLLNEFGRKIIVHAFSEYMEERIAFAGKKLSREGHIRSYIQALAGAIGNGNIESICSI